MSNTPIYTKQQNIRKMIYEVATGHRGKEKEERECAREREKESREERKKERKKESLL